MQLCRKSPPEQRLLRRFRRPCTPLPEAVLLPAQSGSDRPFHTEKHALKGAYQSAKPAKGDWSEGYQAVYHEHMLKMWAERPYIWAMHCWNMFDFGADGRDEGGKPGQNQKGLVTFFCVIIHS